ncbi:MAG: RNA polymerase sigma factor [Pirellulales bacterium]
MSVTNETLLERVRNTADHAAWGEFFAIYEPLLLNYVRGRVRDRSLGWNDHDIQDVVQDIFIKLYRTLPDFQLDHGRGRFRTWLYRITINAILDRVPGRKSADKLAAEQADSPDGAPQARRRPKVHDEGQVDLRHVAVDAVEPDLDWANGYRQAVLDAVLPQIQAEVSATNPNKWESFARHGLECRPAAEVAAELGINANLVYQNTARVLDLVRRRCLECYDEELSEV